jgi:hypothetical protein
MADPKDKQIDDIVSMLDEFMGGNGGHMNIRVAENGTINADKTLAKTMNTTSSSDCAEGDMACKVPTLFSGLDQED